jgi:predicted RNase H-like nuclease (RuvC/YqgF family)
MRCENCYVTLREMLAERDATIAALTATAEEANRSYIDHHNTIESLRRQLADATRKLEEARKDAERLDFMWERQVTMYDQHPNYMPMCICFDDGTGERVTIVAQNLREAIDQAIEQGKGGDDAK